MLQVPATEGAVLCLSYINVLKGNSVRTEGDGGEASFSCGLHVKLYAFGNHQHQPQEKIQKVKSDFRELH